MKFLPQVLCTAAITAILIVAVVKVGVTAPSSPNTSGVGPITTLASVPPSCGASSPSLLYLTGAQGGIYACVGTRYSQIVTNYRFAANEIPAGAADGRNRVFTLSYAPNPPSSLQLFNCGLLMKKDLDYTLSGQTITFAQGAWLPNTQMGVTAAFYQH